MLTSVSTYNSAQIGQGWVLTYDNGEAFTVRSRLRSGSEDPLNQFEIHINNLCRAHQSLMAKIELMEEQLFDSNRALATLQAQAVSDPLYAMKLHESIETDEHTITRVPGGWIYWNIAASNSTFVPYNNEFQPKA